MSTIESVLQESRLFAPPADFVKRANVSGMPAYQVLCAEAERAYESFSARLTRENLLWHKPFSSVLDETKAPFFKWFGDGELNVSYNCLDRHLNSQSNACEPVWVNAEHPLFILYTSGSTGKPKGVQHSSAGYLLHAMLSKRYWIFLVVIRTTAAFGLAKRSDHRHALTIGG